MANLLEAFKNRLTISEQVYSKAHNGEGMSDFKKLVTAKCLSNINNYLNEAFENSTGTQRSDLGQWKKFSLNLSSVAVPNLISYDLVLVQPMSSMTGYISYIRYTAGSDKGQTTKGTVFNDPFRLGNVDTSYTSEAVVENVTVVNAGQAQNVTPIWTPVVAKSFVDNNTDYAVKIMDTTTATGAVTITYANLTSGSFSLTPVAGHTYKYAYRYDNVVIPQNDLPLLNAKIEGIALTAKARRIAVYYSQMAAFQAKTDYGFDLGDQLAEKAVGQLSYEIDTEVTNLLVDNASQDGDLVWSKTLPVGVSKSEHYEGFTEIVEMGKQKVYDRTKRFAPNYMLIASNVLPILTFIKGFTAASTSSMNGPYFAGTLNGLKVFVTPNIQAGKFVLGVNGDDMMSSAAIYAPYMPIVPTQLLGYSDGGMSQGFSTMYDLKILNSDLLVAGRITA